MIVYIKTIVNFIKLKYIYIDNLNILELENSKYYVGKTNKPVNERLFEHFNRGSNENNNQS